MKQFHIAAAVLLVFSGCLSYLRAPAPLAVIYHQKEKNSAAETLVVFLPGNLMEPEEFTREGFVDILQKSKISADSAAVDAGLGYYIKRTLPERLMADVIEPAKKAGYRRIWLVGISMGGSGALWLAKEHPDAVTGVILLAPFLGDGPVIREIRKAGGVMKWDPAMPLHKDDYQRAQWLWLKKYSSESKRLPSMIVGFGSKDPFAGAGRLLAEILPKNGSLELTGGHDWTTWRALFDKIVAGGALER